MKKLILIFTLIINTIAFSQDDKTVTLVVSGQGKTQDEAKQNALRSAIEQAFGTFISSKTEILNDNLVKDEIVSIANGNVKSYEVLDQLKISENQYNITLKALVSIDNLVNFVKSKGHEVEYNGGVYAFNIKMQKLNEIAEYKSVSNLMSLYHEVMQTGYDYEIITENPILHKQEYYEEKQKEELWAIPIKVNVKRNNSLDSILDYITRNLRQIAIKGTEEENYRQSNKKVYEFEIYKDLDYNTNASSRESYYLCSFRNEKSKVLVDLFMNEMDGFYKRNFIVKSNIDSLIINKGNTYDNSPEPITYMKLNKDLKIGLGGGEYFFNKENNTYARFLFYNVLTLNELEKLSKMSISSRGVLSKFEKDGFLLDNEKIIVSINQISRVCIKDRDSIIQDYRTKTKENWQIPNENEMKSIFKNVTFGFLPLNLIKPSDNENILGNVFHVFSDKKLNEDEFEKKYGKSVLYYSFKSLGAFSLHPNSNESHIFNYIEFDLNSTEIGKIYLDEDRNRNLYYCITGKYNNGGESIIPIIRY